jgi:two-component system OmpR family response regulator
MCKRLSGIEGQKMRILLVEDDQTIANFIAKGLNQASFAVDHRSDGEQGLNLALTESYDAAIIDLMLPTLDGLSLIRELRQHKLATPVIILSAKRSVGDRVEGFHTGSDDYLTKPFAFVELLARLQALIRRTLGGVEPTRLKTANISMDLLTRQVVRADRRIELQPREFALLEYLLRNVDRVVSKTMILEHVWNYHFDPQTNVVDVLICRLRDKMDRDCSEKLIHTIRGLGYVLKRS